MLNGTGQTSGDAEQIQNESSETSKLIEDITIYTEFGVVLLMSMKGIESNDILY